MLCAGNNGGVHFLIHVMKSEIQMCVKGPVQLCEGKIAFLKARKKITAVLQQRSREARDTLTIQNEKVVQTERLRPVQSTAQLEKIEFL